MNVETERSGAGMDDPREDQPIGPFDTERLSLAGWGLGNSGQALVGKLSAELEPILTEAVLKHLPEPLQIGTGEDAVEQWILERDAESQVLAVRLKETQELLGLLILAPFSDGAGGLTVHTGYLFGEHAWGKGYATEMLLGLIGWYRERGGRLQLLGGVEKDNAASARVLIKAGFVRVDALSDENTDMFGRNL